MTISQKTQLTRLFGRIAVVGAAGLTLASAIPTTTEARPRQPHRANGEIEICMGSGGDPYLFEYWGVWAVGCEYTSVTTGTWDDVASEQITATDDRDTSSTHAQHHQKRKHASHVRKRG